MDEYSFRYRQKCGRCLCSEGAMDTTPHEPDLVMKLAKANHYSFSLALLVKGRGWLWNGYKWLCVQFGIDKNVIRCLSCSSRAPWNHFDAMGPFAYVDVIQRPGGLTIAYMRKVCWLLMVYFG